MRESLAGSAGTFGGLSVKDLLAQLAQRVELVDNSLSIYIGVSFFTQFEYSLEREKAAIKPPLAGLWGIRDASFSN